jgi:hypothetical protein
MMRNPPAQQNVEAGNVADAQQSEMARSFLFTRRRIETHSCRNDAKTKQNYNSFHAPENGAGYHALSR